MSNASNSRPTRVSSKDHGNIARDSRQFDFTVTFDHLFEAMKEHLDTRTVDPAYLREIQDNARPV